MSVRQLFTRLRDEHRRHVNADVNADAFLYPNVNSADYWYSEEFVSESGGRLWRICHDRGKSFARQHFTRRRRDQSVYWNGIFRDLRAWELSHPPRNRGTEDLRLRFRDVFGLRPLQPRDGEDVPLPDDDRHELERPPVLIDLIADDEVRADDGDEVRPDDGDEVRADDPRRALVIARNALDIADRGMTAKDAEIVDKTRELEAKTRELEAKTAEYTTCRYGACAEPSVFGLRCAAGHGLCQEHSEEHCAGIAEYLTETTCVVPGCDEKYLEVSFERSGAARDVVARCAQRLHREEFERQAALERERARREVEDDSQATRGLRRAEMQAAVNLVRPCCGNIFGDFQGCMTMRCDFQTCRKFFCACCLDCSFDVGDGSENAVERANMDCHDHVLTCTRQHFGAGSYFFTTLPGETREHSRHRLTNHYEKIRVRRIDAYLRRTTGVEIPPPPRNA
jgi:hypothetical protein